jgi:UDP-GlcNAc:undecaprenyl-phosphate GlcNAc-1-phosphate transferase
MKYWDAALAFLAAMAIAALLTPLAARLARRVGAIDFPRARGLSQKPTPKLGGLAILAGILVASLVWLPGTIHLPVVPHALSGGTVHTWAILLGAVVITAVGAVDDWRDLSPPVKLAGQVVAAVIAVEGGVNVSDLTLPVIGPLQFPNEGGVLSAIWLVGLMNVVNFSDGVDGLAAGLCTIDGIAFAVIIFDLHGAPPDAAKLAALTAGGALGFLFFNFPPARVFMGDSGANLLGYLLGVVGVIGSLKTPSFVALVVPLLILAVPFLDTGFVVAKRLKYHRKPWTADDTHFHHRMRNIGFSPRKTIAYLYAWTLMLAGVALALRLVPYSNHDGHYYVGWSFVMGAILLLALAASVYLVYVLEILKFKGVRTKQLREADPDTSEHEIVAAVRREVETGEFERVRDRPERLPERGEGEPEGFDGVHDSGRVADPRARRAGVEPGAQPEPGRGDAATRR